MLSKIIPQEKIDVAKKLINQYDKISIVSHVSPDGDAIGSSLALYHFLNELGKDVNVIVPDNFPPFLSWMKGANDIIIAEKNEQLARETLEISELIFCLDFNELSRIEHMSPLLEEAKGKKIMIDHHLKPSDFADLVISHSDISSTAELIFRFICQLSMYDLINNYCAECIYTGMMTDTGAFTYNSNQPEIYFIISELLKKGIDKDAIYAKVYNNYTESRIRLQGYLFCEKLKIYEEYNTAMISLSHEEQNRFRYKKGDTEGFVNIPLSIEKIVFSAFIRQEKDVIRISLRSKGDFPANEFAEEVFNGGGHRNASGGEYIGSLEDAIALFEKALPEFIEKRKL